MSDRLPWQRADKPGRFVSIMPEGRVELWYNDEGAQMERGWCFRIMAGEAIELVRTYGAEKQAAADEATRLWPGIVRKEEVRVARIEARKKLHQQIGAANDAGTVDVMAFGIGSSDYDRLMEIMTFMSRRRWLDGPLKPLREAVSEELYRRRTGH
jgi:hypothetical protein